MTRSAAALLRRSEKRNNSLAKQSLLDAQALPTSCDFKNKLISNLKRKHPELSNCLKVEAGCEKNLEVGVRLNIEWSNDLKAVGTVSGVVEKMRKGSMIKKYNIKFDDDLVFGDGSLKKEICSTLIDCKCVVFNK